MAKRSAGILPYRWRNGALQVLLAHPGGPFWKKRDEASWSLAKGEYEAGEDPEAAARREFTEETGWEATSSLVQLGDLRQAGGKHLTAFAMEADLDPMTAVSNTFELEWPPNSGRKQSFPEVDRVEWFGLRQARQKILNSQEILLERLEALLADVKR